MHSDSRTLFDVGDSVLIKKSGDIGIIKEINSVLGAGQNAYVVTIGNKERMYSEACMSLIKKNIELHNINVDNISLLVEVEDKMDEIIRLLKLVKTDDVRENYNNACKLQRYLVLKEEEKEQRLLVSNNVMVSELYHGLLNGVADFITYSLMFSEILKRVGMKVLNVALQDEDGDYYMSNLVLLGDKYYYFDVNLEREIYLENQEKNENFDLCCAGIGYGKYEEFFKPLSVLNFDKNPDNTLPRNVALDDFDNNI